MKKKEVWTIKISGDDEESYIETPMKYCRDYYTFDDAIADAQKLADEHATEEGKMVVYVMGGEYETPSGDILGEPYVVEEIKTGRGWSLFRESASKVPEFLNVERFRKEIKEVLDEETKSWEPGYMQDFAEDYIDEYVEGVVDDAINSFNELVHRADTSMWGNFKNIKYNWEGYHNELPHGCTLKEVVGMIDAGEDNETTREFKDWAVDWYFEAFGTHNLKYNWTNFMEEATYEDEDAGDYDPDGKIVKESYEVSPDLADRLNSILADEFLAAEFYRLAELAMKGNKQHRLSEIADENGKDELDDHFKNLSEWMQSKGIKVVTNHDEMLDITGATVFTVEDGDSTKDIIDKLIQSEEEAIEAYENLIPDTDLDLHTMLCGFLKDEREHLKALKDARDEMGGSEDEARKSKHNIYESSEDDVKFRVYDIDWDTDGEDVDLPDEVVVTVPGDVYAAAGSSSYISDWLSDEYGFCHNGFLIDEI